MSNLQNNSERVGRIIKGVGGFYDVMTDGGIIRCKARGAFRNIGVTPLVGDRVRLTVHASGYAQLMEILPRKNELIRPAAANIDHLLIVISARIPEPDWMLADKLIIEATRIGIEPVMILNKSDDADAQVVDAFMADYRLFRHYITSAETGEGIAALSQHLQAGISCFAGQSAVGKTSLLNALLPGTEHMTGALSEKTERGRHTTRHAELMPFGEGAILDTPGFSLLSASTPTQEKLDGCYPEFSLADRCRYTGCAHISEPDCGVKRLVDAGKMTVARYDRYVTIRKEIEERRKHRYD